MLVTRQLMGLIDFHSLVTNITWDSQVYLLMHSNLCKVALLTSLGEQGQNAQVLPLMPCR